MWAHNFDDYKLCTMRTVNFWAAKSGLRITRVIDPNTIRRAVRSDRCWT